MQPLSANASPLIHIETLSVHPTVLQRHTMQAHKKACEAMHMWPSTWAQCSRPDAACQHPVLSQLHAHWFARRATSHYWPLFKQRLLIVDGCCISPAGSHSLLDDSLQHRIIDITTRYIKQHSRTSVDGKVIIAGSFDVRITAIQERDTAPPRGLHR